MSSFQRILVTGGCGFIGSAVVRYILSNTDAEVLNVDKLTYAAVPSALDNVTGDKNLSNRYQFVQADIANAEKIQSILNEFAPDAIMHLAAESHVDRSIDGPAEFIQSNIVGTYVLLDQVLKYYRGLPSAKQESFRFHNISTDEVFGSLYNHDPAFTEETRYDPRSPYSASKAASDHLVRAWYHTYNLPVVISNCSNNYGPFQFPEKLIPVTIARALAGNPIQIYGKGENIRDWLHVDDHAKALYMILTQGRLGESYNVGGSTDESSAERMNVDVVNAICDCLDKAYPKAKGGSYKDLITFVTDRPGHDFRYAMNATKIRKELGWTPQYSFATGLEQTVQWYLNNKPWWQALTARYDGSRLGVHNAKSEAA
jgi:dTDP-glucose 4,6-dehydratase